MPDSGFQLQRATCCDLAPGEPVLYIRRSGRGPRYGTRGVVTETNRRTAVVELAGSGTWHVPYQYLAAAAHAA